jgi:hypothetical protein
VAESRRSFASHDDELDRPDSSESRRSYELGSEERESNADPRRLWAGPSELSTEIGESQSNVALS